MGYLLCAVVWEWDGLSFLVVGNHSYLHHRDVFICTINVTFFVFVFHFNDEVLFLECLYLIHTVQASHRVSFIHLLLLAAGFRFHPGLSSKIMYL